MTICHNHSPDATIRHITLSKADDQAKTQGAHYAPATDTKKTFTC